MKFYIAVLNYNTGILIVVELLGFKNRDFV